MNGMSGTLHGRRRQFPDRLSACVGSVQGVLLAALVASVNVLGQTARRPLRRTLRRRPAWAPGLAGTLAGAQHGRLGHSGSWRSAIPWTSGAFQRAGREGVVEGNEIPYQAGALEQKQENFGTDGKATRKRSVICPGCRASPTCPIPFKSFNRQSESASFMNTAHDSLHLHGWQPHPDIPGEFWRAILEVVGKGTRSWST